MDRFDDDTLLAELRELRPTPRPEFTAELDERAAAGFPRRDSHASTGRFVTLAAHLRDLRGMTARQWLVPVVGLAIAVFAVGIVAVAISNSGGGHSSSAIALDEEATSGGGISAGAAEESSSAGVETKTEQRAEHSPRQKELTEEVLHANGGVALPETAQELGGSCEVGTAGCNSQGKFDGNFFGESSRAEHGGEKAAEESAGTAEAEESAAGYPARGHRDIERSAAIVLGTKPGEVAGAAAKVYAAVHAANGVVLNSSVESGRTGPTGASFSLLIPSRKLDDALASFSQIAEVRSRHDATNDITAPTVGVTEELRDSNASIEGLLKELGNVETEAERESVEARLREERRHHAAIRASLEHLHKRASMSEVSLRIVTNHGAGVVPASKGDGGWSVGDALHDAGHILTVAAGVLLIALAILAPIALIALLLWSLNRFRVRRLRERALG
jgi:hypothetical protein